MTKHLILDANNLLFRARYAAARRPYENVIIHTFFRSLKPLIEKFSPDHVYFVLDGKSKKRLALSPSYKGTRKYHNDDNFREQRKLILNLISQAVPFVVLRHPDVEADDIIADLTLNQIPEDDEKIIISSDTDFIQLLQTCSNTRLYNPITKSFREAPEYSYVTWKALRGDSADNILGIPGIGNKRAATLAGDSDKMQSFFEKKGCEIEEVYKRNIMMIKLDGLTQDECSGVEVSFMKGSLLTLRESFTELNFKSMISPMAWAKYSKPFEELSDVESFYP